MRKWFEINLGWFFINGRKQQQWNEYLKKKYESIKQNYGKHKKISN